MNKLLLALLSGLFLAFSWPSIGIFPLIFIAFIPLFILEKESKNSKEVFWYSFLAFFIFNVITTYWIYNATPFGSIAAFSLNAGLMTISFWLFHKIRKTSSDRLGYISFVFSWLSIEYLNLDWDLSWPWLILGNVFADFPSIVQWYEFSGFLGGSFWVLLINILLFRVYDKKYTKKVFFLPILAVLLPVLLSYYMYSNPQHIDSKPINVLIVQPNIDPYFDKFSKSYQSQLADFIALARESLTDEIQLLIGPETALLEGLWENRFESSYSILALRDLQVDFPNLKILIGATTYKMFGYGEQKTNTAREIKDEKIFYDAYNSAILIPDSGDIQVYHKTKLVPGVEKMPFPYLLDPLAKLVVNLGGTSGSLGSQNNINSFLVDGVCISPLICYESVYGDMSLGKTNLLAIITNDGWWKNTAGYKQHFAYASLRAIEQRKPIVRSANTGISAVIDARGRVIVRSLWDEKVCLDIKVDVNNKVTFYSKFGDYFGRISAFIFFIFLIVNYVKWKLH